MTTIEVGAGRPVRRRWSEERKRELVGEAFAPGAVVTAIARQADVLPTQLYQWRRELLEQSSGFAEVVVTASRRGESDGAALIEPAIEIALSQTAHVRIPASISPALASAVVGALRLR